MIFGVGVDIIEVARIEDKLKRTPGLKEKIYTIEIYGRAKEFCQTEGISHFYLSLSHLGTLAVATVILEK